MKQQILIINGGSTFLSNKDYISHLKSKEIDLERLKARKDWKDSLQEELGERFEVFVPKMPNVTNARFEEWKIWFERIIDKFDENIILIGHSLGGIFLAKYLSENKSLKKIKATILVAAPFDDKDGKESLSGFNFSTSLKGLIEQGGKIYLIQSKDDQVVPIGELEKYRKALPEAETLILEDKGHFKIESFPELVGLIRSLGKMNF